MNVLEKCSRSLVGLLRINVRNEDVRSRAGMKTELASRVDHYYYY